MPHGWRNFGTEFGLCKSIPSQAPFRSVSNPLSARQLPCLDNDRNDNTKAKLLIPNTLLIRQAAMLGVAGREGRKAQVFMRRQACLGTDGFSSNEERTVFLKMSPSLISQDH